MAKFCTCALLGLAILLSMPISAETSGTATETTLCDIVQNPSRYFGTRVRVRVQEGVDQSNTAVLTAPLSPDSMFEIPLKSPECTVPFESKVVLPKDWVMAVAMGGPAIRILPVLPLIAYGPEATVIAKVRYARKAPGSGFVVRRSEALIKTDFWDAGASYPTPEIMLAIESVVPEVPEW